MEISEQVIKVLDAVCDKFGIAIDWTSIFYFKRSSRKGYKNFQR